ncbi:MAG: tetraacyldisaccharide 4'-kinase [Planctomycetota bacterium]
MMSFETRFRQVISDEGGTWTAPLRTGLAMLEPFYAAAVSVRNRKYDRQGPSVRVPIPVISIGNLTVGGTGKTPFVIKLARDIEVRGLDVAVISRGYKAQAGQRNDEHRMIAQACPGVLCMSDSDRGRAAQAAWKRHGAKVILLDDGFQHRTLHRDLDIVLIDATCPFGFDRLLPRGLLREPVQSLRRAHMIVVTRSDQVSTRVLSELGEKLRSLAPNADHLQAVHRLTAVNNLKGAPLQDSLDGARVVAFSGIANPESFLTTLRILGAEVVASRFFPDHHPYSPRDFHELFSANRWPIHDRLVTTEKDAIKLDGLSSDQKERIFVIKIAIDFLAEGGKILHARLEDLLTRSLDGSVPSLQTH